WTSTECSQSSGNDAETRSADFAAAAEFARIVVPVLRKTGTMTSSGCDLYLNYTEPQTAAGALFPRRHDFHVDLSAFAAMIANPPGADIERHRLGLQGLEMFGEACMLRVFSGGGELMCHFFWDHHMGCGSGGNLIRHEPFLRALAKAVAH